MNAYRLFFTVFLLASCLPVRATDTDAATGAINSLGIDLLTKMPGSKENALLSPYSIQDALAMTYAGAAGRTKDEMQKALYFPKESATLTASFTKLRSELDEVAERTRKIVASSNKRGGAAEPVSLSAANRLYGQEGFDFRQPFLDVMKSDYGASLESVDFVKNRGGATKQINEWVAGRTQQHIVDLVPAGALTRETRLVLVNAFYLKAAWASEFEKSATHARPFHIGGGETKDVDTMSHKLKVGYLKTAGFTAVSVDYLGSELQFLILLPDKVDGLAALEAELSTKILTDCSKLQKQEVLLYLPKLKLTPPTLALGDQLRALGMKSAFDIPRGSANFEIIAPRQPDEYLYISEVFHKTFLSLDEYGTEAAAATAVVMMRYLTFAEPQQKPLEVHVDHPFLFAIQHSKSGACLFLGHVTDPGTVNK